MTHPSPTPTPKETDSGLLQGKSPGMWSMVGAVVVASLIEQVPDCERGGSSLGGPVLQCGSGSDMESSCLQPSW